MPSVTLQYPREGYSTVRRFNSRGTHELEVIHSIINSSPILHVSFNTASSPFPMILPMIGFMGSFARPSAGLGDVLDLYLHGYVSSRLMSLSRVAAGESSSRGDELEPDTAPSTMREWESSDSGLPVSVAASFVDGLVLTSTPNGHVYNYRSAVLFGYAVPVDDDAEKLWAMKQTTNSVVPGRWDNLVLPLARSELTSTSVLRVTIKTGSAKIRTGPPSAETGDCDMSVWRGVLPVFSHIGEPMPTPERKDSAVPAHVAEFRQAFNEAGRRYAMEAAEKDMNNMQPK